MEEREEGWKEEMQRKQYIVSGSSVSLIDQVNKARIKNKG